MAKKHLILLFAAACVSTVGLINIAPGQVAPSSPRPLTLVPNRPNDPAAVDRLPTEPNIGKYLAPRSNLNGVPKPTTAPHVELLRLYDGHPVLALIGKPTFQQVASPDELNAHIAALSDSFAKAKAERVHLEREHANGLSEPEIKSDGSGRK